MSTRLLGRPTGSSPIVSARHSSFPRAWSPNEARWEPRRGVIPELLLDRTAFWGRQQPASLDKTLIAPRRGVIPELLLDRTAFWGRQQPASLDKTLIARGHRPTEEPMPQCT